MIKKLILSYSSIKKYKECPKKYFLSKKYKVKTMGSSLPFGKAIDIAIDYMLSNKDKRDVLDKSIALFLESWYINPPDNFNDAIQIFDNTDYSYYKSDYEISCLVDKQLRIKDWTKELLNSEDYIGCYKEISRNLDIGKPLTKKERLFYNRISWLCLQVKGVLMLEAFYENIIPNVEEVISTQEEVRLQNDEGDEKVGYIDCILKYKGYDRPIIFDIKTAGRFYTKHNIETSEQLRGYLSVVGEELNTNLIGYIILLKKPKAERFCNKCGDKKEGNKKKCVKCGEGKYEDIKLYAETQVIIDSVSIEKLESMMDDDANVLTAIRNGVIYKNPENCMNYNRKCDFYDICWNGISASKLKHLEEK